MSVVREHLRAALSNPDPRHRRSVLRSAGITETARLAALLDRAHGLSVDAPRSGRGRIRLPGRRTDPVAWTSSVREWSCEVADAVLDAQAARAALEEHACGDTELLARAGDLGGRVDAVRSAQRLLQSRAGELSQP